MRTVKFLKDHLSHKRGDVAIVGIGEANYFMRTGVAMHVKTEQPESAPVSNECEAVKTLATKAAAPKKATKKAVVKKK
jgi:hypothetical protein